MHLGHEQLERAQLVERALGDRQPAEAIGHLRRALGRPQRRVAPAQTLRHARLRRLPQLLLDLCSQRRRKAGLDGQRGVAHATIVMGAALL